LGERDEARRHLDIGQALFPEEPNFVAAQAYLLAADGRRAEALAALERARGQFRPRRLEAMRRVVDFLDRLQAIRTADDLVRFIAGGQMAIVGSALAAEEDGEHVAVATASAEFRSVRAMAGLVPAALAAVPRAMVL